MKLDKRTYFGIVIVVVALVVMFLCFYYAEHNNGLIQIPVFTMIYQVIKMSLEWTVGFLWLFGKMIWIAVFSSWISVLVVLGLVVLGILKYFYRKSETN